MNSKSLRTIFTTAIAICTTAVLFIAIMAYRNYNLYSNGVQATGKVLKYERTMCNKTLCYLYTVAFTSIDGKEYIVMLNMGSGLHKTGDAVQLMYKPDDPQAAQLYDGGSSVKNAGGAILFLLGCIAAFAIGRKYADKFAKT